MYSTAPMVMRTVKKDVRLGDYFLPAGTHLCLHVYAMHNISHNWERHDEFLPVCLLKTLCPCALVEISTNNKSLTWMFPY